MNIKKQTLVLCAVLFTIEAHAEISFEGRGSVETEAIGWSRDYVYSVDAVNGTETVNRYQGPSATALFNRWNTEDTDLWIRGDWEFGGFNLNLSFEGLTQAVSGTPPLNIGDWGVWIMPIDIYRPVPNIDKLFHFALRLSATNEDNRMANRYNTIIDKLETEWGTLRLGNGPGRFNDVTFGANAASTDDDSFKGYLITIDTTVVSLDLGFNNAIISNEFNLLSPFIHFQNESRQIGAGVRAFFPIEGLLNIDTIFKTVYTENTTGNTAWRDGFEGVFAAIFDISLIPNMGIALGYTGHWYHKMPSLYDPVSGAEATAQSGQITDILVNAVEFRFQTRSGYFGTAVHNNTTFAIKQDRFILADKLNLGFSYELTDSLTLITEIQNYIWLHMNDAVQYALFDTVSLYPRFTAEIVADHVSVQFGLRIDAEMAATRRYWTQEPIGGESGPIGGGNYAQVLVDEANRAIAKRFFISLPLSLEVRF